MTDDTYQLPPDHMRCPTRFIVDGATPVRCHLVSGHVGRCSPVRPRNRKPNGERTTEAAAT
jgi:hypothetical protein